MSLEKQVPHRQVIKDKPSVSVQEVTIDYIDDMQSVTDYGEIQFQMVTDYKKLIQSAESESEKAYYIGQMIQHTLMIHSVGLLNDVY